MLNSARSGGWLGVPGERGCASASDYTQKETSEVILGCLQSPQHVLEFPSPPDGPCLMGFGINRLWKSCSGSIVGTLSRTGTWFLSVQQVLGRPRPLWKQAGITRACVCGDDGFSGGQS